MKISLTLSFLGLIAYNTSSISHADAAVLYKFDGKIDYLEYNNVPYNAQSPYYVDQAISAFIYIPNLSVGPFLVDGQYLYVSSVPYPQRGGTIGSVYFSYDDGSEFSIGLDPGGTAAIGSMSAPGVGTIQLARFCCAVAETAEVVFTGESFRAVFLPTGMAYDNVAAYGSGTWIAYAIPEPHLSSFLGIAAWGLLATLRSRRRLSA